MTWGSRTLRRACRSSRAPRRKSNIAVVFYAGHGIEVDKRTLSGAGGRPPGKRSGRGVRSRAVGLALRAAGRASGLGLVILDACRNNPFLASMQRSGATRAIGRGLVRVEPEGQTLVAYAAKEGTTADDGKGPQQSVHDGAAALSGGAGLGDSPDVPRGARHRYWRRREIANSPSYLGRCRVKASIWLRIRPGNAGKRSGGQMIRRPCRPF